MPASKTMNLYIKFLVFVLKKLDIYLAILI